MTELDHVEAARPRLVLADERLWNVQTLLTSRDVHCLYCGRKVAEGSAHVDEDGNPWDAHWDCASRAELERRARDAGPGASERSLRGRIGAYTRWANTEDRSMATRPAREGLLREV
jgi:hypothetical protein